MENRKYLSGLHGAFSVIGIVLYTVSFIRMIIDGVVPIGLTSIVLNMVALTVGLIYLLKGYKKEAANYYKAFMWILVVSELLEAVARISSLGTTRTFDIFTCILPFAFFLLLAGAKDYGKRASFILSIALLLSMILQIIPAFAFVRNIGPAYIYVVIDFIGQFAIAGITVIMVCEKYLDKAARGAK